jgi:hypothetical protein
MPSTRLLPGTIKARTSLKGMTLNSCCPHFHIIVAAKHRTPSKSLNCAKTRTSIASPPIWPSWYSPSRTSPWTISHMMATKNRASRRSLQNKTVGIKVWVCTAEYHPIQQTPGIGALLYSPAEASKTSHFGQIEKN